MASLATRKGAAGDFAIRLAVYKPYGERLGYVHDLLDIQVTYPVSDLPALKFTARKDSPGMEHFLLTSGVEVATELYVPRADKWIEPFNGRFLVLDWEEDMVDEANTVTFTAPGFGWLLSKLLVHKRPQDDADLEAEELAWEGVEQAKDDYDDALREFNSVVNRVRADAELDGPFYVMDTPPGYIDFKRPVNDTLLFCPPRHRFLRWLSTHNFWTPVFPVDHEHTVDAHEAWVLAERYRVTYENLSERYDNLVSRNAETTRNHKRPMVNVTAGEVMNRLLEESSEGNPLNREGRPTIERNFNGTYSSSYSRADAAKSYYPDLTGRLAWNSRFNLELTIGQTYFDVLNDLTEMGEAEWFFHGRTLHLYRPGDLGVKLTEEVSLRPGKDMTSAPNRSTRREHAHYLHIRGEDNVSFGTHNPQSSIGGWGVWEKAIAISGVEGRGALIKAAIKEARDAAARIKVESTRPISLGNQNEGDYLPMYDYLPGQYISAYDTDGKVRQDRVMSISIMYDDQEGLVGSITLGDRFLVRALDFRKTMARTLGGYEKVIGGGTVPLLPSAPAPTPGGKEDKRPLPFLAASVRAGVNNLSGQPSTILKLNWQFRQDLLNVVDALPGEIDD